MALIDACGLCLGDAFELVLAMQVRFELGEHAEHVEEALTGDGRLWRAPWKGGAFQWVQVPPGKRSSRKQPEQLWR